MSQSALNFLIFALGFEDEKLVGGRKADNNSWCLRLKGHLLEGDIALAAVCGVDPGVGGEFEKASLVFSHNKQG